MLLLESCASTLPKIYEPACLLVQSESGGGYVLCNLHKYSSFDYAHMFDQLLHAHSEKCLLA